MQTVFERLRTISSDVFDVPVNAITPASSPENLELWDSVQHLNLILAIEEQFDVSFTAEEIERMKSIGGIEELVSSKASRH